MKSSAAFGRVLGEQDRLHELVLAADWMPTGTIIFIGQVPREPFASDEEFYREWEKRCAVITNVAFAAPPEQLTLDKETT